MRTEKEKMLAGEHYMADDPALLEELVQTRIQIGRFNAIPVQDIEAQRALLKGLMGRIGDRFTINQPFRCDYGKHIFLGEDFFANFNLTILDEAHVTIGEHAFIGPNVSIYTACHPLDAKSRNALIEWAEPVTIGNNVWIGGDVTILPGVTIGDDVVIGAGSVVTKDVESGTVVAGNPARVIKRLEK